MTVHHSSLWMAVTLGARCTPLWWTSCLSCCYLLSPNIAAQKTAHRPPEPSSAPQTTIPAPAAEEKRKRDQAIAEEKRKRDGESAENADMDLAKS